MLPSKALTIYFMVYNFILKDTIENRGGTIAAAHNPDGVGTMFIVHLPLAERGEEA